MYTVDLYLRVRLACHVDGLSQREAASRFGIARETVRKMLRHSEPPGYRRRQPPKRPKLAPFTDIIDRILEEDRPVHRKQHHTAKRIAGTTRRLRRGALETSGRQVQTIHEGIDETDRVIPAHVIVHCFRQKQNLRAVNARNVSHGGP